MGIKIDIGLSEAVPGGMASPPEEPTNTSSTELVASLQADGYTVVELDTVGELRAASHGEAPYDTDDPDTVYLIKNGTYNYGTSPVLDTWVAGLSAARKRYFIGETRHGVILTGKVIAEADNIVLQNFKMDMSAYDQGGSYSSISIPAERTVMLL